MSNLIKVKGYLEDREGTIRTFTPNQPPHGIRDSKGFRPPYATITYIGCEGELTTEEVLTTKSFVFKYMLSALADNASRYSILIKPLWFQQLLLSKGQ